MKDYLNKLKLFCSNIAISPRFKLIGIVSAICFAALIILFIWLHARHFINTDNAYVNANVIQIAPQVSGKVLRLYVENNQHVKEGTLLFEIDPEPYMVALTKATAQLGIAQAVWNNAQANTKRIVELVNKKALSTQDKDDATKNLNVAAASLQLAKASVEQAKLDLRNTRVYAPTSGTITNMVLRAGNIVEVNKPLFVFISSTKFWVDANFKETELRNIHVGQTAEVIVDMYPAHIFHGVVESISGGSGAAFSLLPPQNATGNWIKITQRIPVKINILNLDSQYSLRIGSTANVAIDIDSTAK
jgi:membrane fusion protein, multidrug efflux system